MTTQQHDTAALTDEQVDGVAGGIDIGPVGLRSVHIVDPTYIIDPTFIPRPLPLHQQNVGPCATSGRARVIWPQF